MKLKEIYNNKIERDVNPAVSITDDSLNTINTEIDEYVFTDDIINNMYDLLLTIKDTKKQNDFGEWINKHSHVGIWVDGYFGSGKSHFLKYLSYCINPTYSERALNRLSAAVKAIDPLDDSHDIIPSADSFDDVAKWVKDATVKTCNINLLTYKDDNDKEQKHSFLNIFWSLFNKMRGYNYSEFALAQHLEKALDEEGVLTQWHNRMKELNFDWETPTGASALKGRRLNIAIDEAKKLAPSLDYEAIRAAIINGHDVVSNDTFASELQEYLNKFPNQGKDARILFLADEVSMFINGNHSFLGQLQELITRCSEVCDNRVWIICTAQQNLEQVITDCHVQKTTDEYGKIMGRFEVRQSLESTSAKYITQQRILDKKPEVVADLENIYRTKKTALEAQYNLPTGFEGFKDKETFVGYYPFVPFQLDLILKVFSAFQVLGFVMKEVKDNSRSIIRVTHATAKANCEQEVGKFMSFDQFYNTMFKNSLQNSGTRAIENARNVVKYHSDAAFGDRVVSVLFMICNLLTEDRKVFPATLDNITILMMDNIDENKLQLKNRIQSVTDFLIDHHILRVDKNDQGVESFSFFTEAEREVAKNIESQQVDNQYKGEQLQKMFVKMLGAMKNKEKYLGRDFAFRYQFLDHQVFPGNKEIVVDFCFDSGQDTLSQHVLHSNVSNSQLTFFLYPLYADTNNQALVKDLEWYCKVQKVAGTINSISDDKVRAVINDFGKRADEMYNTRILPKLTDMFNKCGVASGLSELSSLDFGNLKSTERLRKAYELHFKQLYHKAAMVQSAAMPKNMAELRTKILRPIHDNEYSSINPMTDAENEVVLVVNRAARTHEITLQELCRTFAEPPYGWVDHCTLYVVNELVRRRQYDYVMNNSTDVETLYIANNVDSQLSHITLRAAQLIPQHIINDFLSAWNNIFGLANVQVTTDGRELCRRCREGQDKDSLESRITEYNEKARLAGNYSFAKPIVDAINKMNGWKLIRDPKRFFENIINDSADGRSVIEEAKKSIKFVDSQMQNYRKVLNFIELNRINFTCLPDDQKQKAQALMAITRDPLPTMQTYGQLMQQMEKAINAQKTEYKKQILDAYQKVYQQLFAICDQNGIEHEYVVVMEQIVQQKQNEENLLLLKQNANTNDFYNEWFKLIVDEHNDRIRRAAQQPTPPAQDDTNTPNPPKPKKSIKIEPVTLNTPNKTLHNVAEVDAYIADLRAQIMDKLIEGEQAVIIM